MEKPPSKLGEVKKRIVENVREKLQTVQWARDFIVEDIPFLDELELHPREIKWIAEVKKSSQIIGNGWLEKNPTAFEIVLAHLTLLRDIKRFGPGKISKVTEDKFDDILNKLVKYFQEKRDSLKQFRDDESFNRIIGWLTPKENDAESKAAALTKFLTWWHVGHSLGLEAIPGKPFHTRWTTDQEDSTFLSNLNNLGNSGWWDKQ